MMSIRLELPYDKSIEPPAPVLSLQILNPVTDKNLITICRIDTGFGGSLLIPYDKYEEIGLRLIEDFELVYGLPINGRRISLRQAYCQVKIKNILQTETKAYTFQGNTKTLLGRELLNRIYLELKGPEKSLSAWL
jgi:predicted aspartyl protease